VSGDTEWTVETLRQYLQRQLDDIRVMLEERHVTQTKAVDAAFLAQRTAMQAALTSAQREVATALLSSENAVRKAEVAAEKRFESVNEFRAQLSDQAATFLSRNEADARISALAEKLDTETARNSARISELELRLTSRLDLRDGASKGVGQGLSWMTAFGGLVLLCIALVGFVVVR
jgi:hypothetical protein